MKWWGGRGSNPRPTRCKRVALPLSYRPDWEHGLQNWEQAVILPLVSGRFAVKRLSVNETLYQLS